MTSTPDNRRTRELLLANLSNRVSGYLPGWRPTETEPAHALLHTAAGLVERLDRGIHDALEHGQLAFLDALNERRLPAQAAEAPIVFTLAETAVSDVRVPSGTLIQAEPAQDQADPPLFATTEAVTIARAAMAKVYSVLPERDMYADHTEVVATGFHAFEEANPIEHSLYLGDELFNLPPGGCGVREPDDVAGPETLLRIKFDFRKLVEDTPPEFVAVQWEFYGTGGWFPLEELDGGKNRPLGSLFGEELVVLRKPFGPASEKTERHGHETYWIRARLTQPLPEDGVDGRGGLPVIDRIFATSESALSGLMLDEAFGVNQALNLREPFYPFGRVPRTHDMFYFACREAFQRSYAQISISIEFAESNLENSTDPLEWEYFDGTSWLPLEVIFIVVPNGTQYTFTRPTSWEELEVLGSKNYWVRIRIEKGGYNDLEAPVIGQMQLSFTHASPTLALRLGTTSNDFIEDDVSAALAIPGRTFRPFRRANLADTALYLAFDRPLPSALVSLYVHSRVDGGPTQRPSRFLWEYWSRDGWRDLSVRDSTASFAQSGTVQFVGPWDAAPMLGLGGCLYRVRARLKEGEAADTIELGGLWFNAVMARDERRYPRVPVGESNGNPEQRFRVAPTQVPVLAGQQLEVREWSKVDGGPPPFLDDLPDDTRVIEDPATQRPAEIWVLWQQRDGLYDSGPDDRHYTLDRASGTIRFGDGTYGRIPPSGSRLVLSHRTGGGLDGNVAAYTIKQPRAVIAGLQSTDNPRPALGGAPTEALGDTLLRGPQRLRHGDRAISESDYEWLAREASRAVARARCLPLTGHGGGGQRGWVTVIVIPHSTESRPQPDAELRREVREALSTRVPAPIARRIRVVAPTYAEVGVVAAILPSANADLTSLARKLRTALDNYLHPLSGGPTGQGWRMGSRIYLSQIAQVVETLTGVDKALELRVRIDGDEQGQVAQIADYVLPAAGAHELSFRFEEGC